MRTKQIYKTDGGSQLMIEIPEKFREIRHILVVLDDSIDVKSEKMNLMKLASKDPLFLSDINELAQDFKTLDIELQ